MSYSIHCFIYMVASYERRSTENRGEAGEKYSDKRVSGFSNVSRRFNWLQWCDTYQGGFKICTFKDMGTYLSTLKKYQSVKWMHCSCYKHSTIGPLRHICNILEAKMFCACEITEVPFLVCLTIFRFLSYGIMTEQKPFYLKWIITIFFLRPFKPSVQNPPEFRAVHWK